MDLYRVWHERRSGELRFALISLMIPRRCFGLDISGATALACSVRVPQTADHTEPTGI